ncbi:hypothetical protein AgCh_037823 [Apium graveolens]
MSAFESFATPPATESKVLQLDEKIGQIRRLIENKVTKGCDIVQEDEFELSAQACERGVEIEAREQGQDQLKQMIEKLENIGKLLADMSKPMKENTDKDNTESNSISSTKTGSLIFDVESSEKSVNRDCVYHFTGYKRIPISKLHENEYGKYRTKGRYTERNKVQYDQNKMSGNIKSSKLELFHPYKEMVRWVTKIDEWPVKSKVAKKLNLLGLLLEDEYDKVEAISKSRKSEINSKVLDKGGTIIFVMALSVRMCLKDVIICAELIMADATMGLICQAVKSLKKMSTKKLTLYTKIMAGICQTVRGGLLAKLWINDGKQGFVIAVDFGLHNFV